MVPSLSYPLEQIIKVKEKRVLEQEKVVKLKEQATESEKKKLAEREKERDAAKEHQQDKLRQLRQELDQGTTSEKVQQMKRYLEVAKEKVAQEEKKVQEQQRQVAQAESALEAAIADLKIKRQQVDKLQDHKKSWTAEMRKEIEIIEAREQDELGSMSYLNHQRMHKKYNK